MAAPAWATLLPEPPNQACLLDEAALTESTYGDSRSLKMRQRLQAGMADFAWTTPRRELAHRRGFCFSGHGNPCTHIIILKIFPAYCVHDFVSLSLYPSFSPKYRITLQGLPTATQSAGMERVTTLPAPITLFFPIVTPGSRIQPPPIQTLSSIRTGRANVRKNVCVSSFSKFRRSCGSTG